ncbi:glycosyltransferase [Chryseobacterium manosquense]|uniref:Glycosyltransferase n=1 Tax=Chryseobacterium manosquense TaxID=2754694 RepID=A0A7H1DWF8_9FLAO|nr:glycosyltransferase [Chryseobacterium manosquense]QNS41316.1 glycosyltransferase [Chryseobacterium manosquense]
MIYIIDRFVNNQLHVLANANTIKLLEIIFPEEQKKFIAEKNHSNYVSEILETVNGSVSYEPYENNEYGNGTIASSKRVFNRLKNDFVFFKILFENIAKNNYRDWVFITHIYPASLPVLKILKLLYPKIKVIITIHGEVEYIYYPKSKFNKLIGSLYSLSFKIKNKNLKYLFLTKVSKEILVSDKILNENEILAIELPTFSDYQLNENMKELVNPLKIGHIGSSGKRKNINIFYQLARNLHQDIENGKLNLYIVGSLENDIKEDINPLIIDFVESKTGTSLPRELYNEKSQDLDFSIVFYGPNDFILRSGAAFFDTIAFEKPIIALENRFFKSVSEVSGPIGYLCTNIEEMENLIHDIASSPQKYSDNYLLFKKNMKLYKESLKSEKIAEDLKFQIGSFFNL